jgi:uncharacterized alpha-E superfamily protein
MLSRAAESLYWMSRYIERAEDITRLLSVNFETALEAHLDSKEAGWKAIITASGDETPFRASFSQFTARNVAEYLLWHPANPNAVAACINRARENARAAREQISTEMWEHINRLYFLVKDTNRGKALRGPHAFFEQVRDGSQAFQGITTATMMHGEPYEFIQLGKYSERAAETLFVLDLKFATVNALKPGSPEAAVQLIAMLKSCSAFEPFRRAFAAQMQAWRVADYLLLNREFPRAVLFCLTRGMRSMSTISNANEPGASRPAALPSATAPRALGRLVAELEYLDIHEVLGEGFRAYLNQLQRRINAVGEEVARSYFNTQVILPDASPQPAQQQQQ